MITKRLFRESCVYYDGMVNLCYCDSAEFGAGHYVKDLSLLNRDISQVIIVDNSPMSYTFHPGEECRFRYDLQFRKRYRLWNIY